MQGLPYCSLQSARHGAMNALPVVTRNAVSLLPRITVLAYAPITAFAVVCSVGYIPVILDTKSLIRIDRANGAEMPESAETRIPPSVQ